MCNTTYISLFQRQLIIELNVIILSTICTFQVRMMYTEQEVCNFSVFNPLSSPDLNTNALSMMKMWTSQFAQCK